MNGLSPSARCAIPGHDGHVAVLTVATCQFPVTADIGANLHHIRRQMVTVSKRGARVAHFPEGVVVGSAHRLSSTHKPHNSLYVISDAGQLAERYDKRFCAGDPAGRSGDLAQYSLGSQASPSCTGSTSSTVSTSSSTPSTPSTPLLPLTPGRTCMTPPQTEVAAASHDRRPAQWHAGQRPPLR